MSKHKKIRYCDVNGCDFWTHDEQKLFEHRTEWEHFRRAKK